MPTYVDTSALAKWYIEEPGSAAVAAFMDATEAIVISSLTGLEMRCLLARRRRAGYLSREMELEVFATFQGDVLSGHLLVRECLDRHFLSAVRLLDQVGDTPLRTLDALHLAIVREDRATDLATADHVQLQAARKLGLKAVCLPPDNT